MTRGALSMLLYLPKFGVLAAIFSVAEPTSNRGVFIRLKISQRNWTRCRSVIRKALARPESIEKNPPPLRALRLPVSPGMVVRYARNAAAGSGNMLGPGLPSSNAGGAFFVVPVRTGAIWVPKPAWSQLVG